MADTSNTREMIVVALMLCHALGRDEAEAVVDEHEERLLTSVNREILKSQVPEHLERPYRYRRNLAWHYGRNDAVSTIFHRIVKLQMKAYKRRVNA